MKLREKVLYGFFNFFPLLLVMLQIKDNPSGDNIPALLAIPAGLSIRFYQFQNSLCPFYGTVIMALPDEALPPALLLSFPPDGWAKDSCQRNTKPLAFQCPRKISYSWDMPCRAVHVTGSLISAGGR